MGKSIAQIRAIINKLDPEMEITDEAAGEMTKIPSFVAGMAIRKTVKRAHQEGVTLIDSDFASKIKGENFP